MKKVLKLNLSKRKKLAVVLSAVVTISAVFLFIFFNKNNPNEQINIQGDDEYILNQANAVFKDGQDYNSDPASALVIAKSFITKGQPEQALGLYSKLIDEKLNDTQLIEKYTNVMQTYLLQKNKDKYIESMNKYLALSNLRSTEDLKTATEYLNSSYVDFVFSYDAQEDPENYIP